MRITDESPRMPIYRYNPKDDITPHEVARLLPILLATWIKGTDPYALVRQDIPGETFNDLPEDLKRHFDSVKA